MGEVSLASVHGQQHREDGVAGAAVEFDDARVTGNEVLRHCKA